MSVAIVSLIMIVSCFPLATLSQDRGEKREPREQQSERGERKRPDSQRFAVPRERADSVRTPRSMPFRPELAPDHSSSDSQSNPQVKQQHRQVFQSVWDGLASGNYAQFAQHLGPQVTLNLRGGESGTYSANQTYYVLENYFRTRRVIHLIFTTIGDSETNPYATGSASLGIRGSRELVQIYVSLSRTGDRWVVTQINIY